MRRPGQSGRRAGGGLGGLQAPFACHQTPNLPSGLFSCTAAAALLHLACKVAAQPPLGTSLVALRGAELCRAKGARPAASAIHGMYFDLCELDSKGHPVHR